jgi:SAM-dependent methyltransferase
MWRGKPILQTPRAQLPTAADGRAPRRETRLRRVEPLVECVPAGMWNAPVTRRGLHLGLLAGLVMRVAPRPQASPAQAEQAGAAPGGSAGDAERWDQVFGRPKPVYRTGANEFLGRVLERAKREHLVAPGDAALDLAMGDGRNALLLAESGLDVTGLDISRVALEKARATAAERKLGLHALEQDLFTYDYGEEKWSLISVIYFNPAVQIFERLKRAVKPGGLLVIEGQGSEHLGDGPPPATRFRPNQLLKAFGDWRVLAYEDGLFECDWALGPPTHVVRLMARRPR